MAPRNSSLVLAGFLFIVLFTIISETAYAQKSTFNELCVKAKGLVVTKGAGGCDKCADRCQSSVCFGGTVLLKSINQISECVFEKDTIGGRCACCCAK
ncbi:hypothetical protein MKW92_050639 [Papaver armeniacum]|nr:hypothetical protein MKW92_050639 [Papaver armeniacum]